MNDKEEDKDPLRKRSLNELDDVIEEIMERNPWFEKHLEEIIKKQTEKK